MEEQSHIESDATDMELCDNEDRDFEIEKGNSTIEFLISEDADFCFIAPKKELQLFMFLKPEVKEKKIQSNKAADGSL